jgi:hypothetical protein
MKIKIVKCSKDTYWYCSHVGEVFEVTDKLAKNDDWYGVWRDKTREAGGFIMKADAVPVEREDVVKLTAFLEWFVKNDIDMSETTPELIIERYLEEINLLKIHQERRLI